MWLAGVDDIALKLLLCVSLCLSSVCVCVFKKRVGDVCNGDSGGGFMMELPGGFKWVLAGIVSFGFKCNSPYHYSYFTNVGMFYDWIDSIAKFTDEKIKLDFLTTTSSEQDPESSIMRVTKGSNLTSAKTTAPTQSPVGQDNGKGMYFVGLRRGEEMKFI
ncbi:hypothetical protein DPMN_121880 [Dreissena polymorpha]|uniref:Peptidase S1 domain-containing protein n=1 Tax=Dreissena polymorpha TaxID=45954 RepID=A0A9D4GRF4_DREPO|nr:hypothetical protein DPMN_121880 [Dreissena polymorpha]